MSVLRLARSFCIDKQTNKYPFTLLLRFVYFYLGACLEPRALNELIPDWKVVKGGGKFCHFRVIRDY